MDRYLKKQRIIVVKTCYKYEESFAEIVCKLHAIFGQLNASNQSTVKINSSKNSNKLFWLWV